MAEQAGSDIFVIAVAGRRAGLGSRIQSGFRFHASNHQFDVMDSREFATIEEMHAAARSTLANVRLGFSVSLS